MDTISRRKFLKLVGAGAAGVAATQLSMADIVFAGQTRPLPTGTPILVVVTLYGGNDGLNTVIPYSDPIYKQSRPGIYVPDSQLLPLDAELALNGTMTGFKTLWDNQNLAIVRGVGYPDPDLSHFSSMAIWQSGLPGSLSGTGWIGRWLDTQRHDPMNAIGLGSVLPPLLAGAKNVGSVLPLGGLVLPDRITSSALQKLSKPDRSDRHLQAAAATAIADFLSLEKSITPILESPAPIPDNLPTQMGGSFGSDSSLSQQLDIVAKLIAANAPTKVWAVSLGGFDTHSDEVSSQSELLGTVSQAVTRFIGQMHGSNRRNDVVVMVYSEFGRRVTANGTQGTDHGTAGPVFVIGNGVDGGKFYGDEPSLSNLIDGNLAVTTDFRDVYAAMLEDVLKVSAAQVIPGWGSKLPLMLQA
jgi:uncharacterized protein (DUF1501 family)